MLDNREVVQNRRCFIRLGVLVTSYARTELLVDCLNSILLSAENLDVPKVVVHQLQFPQVKSILDEYRRDFEIIQVLRNTGSPVDRINLNRIEGYRLLFDKHKVDAVLAIEDDVVIAPDSIKFCLGILKEFRKSRNFRGINLGSRLKIDSDLLLHSYSMLRYGLHGQAGVITHKTWLRLQNYKLGHLPNIGFDSQIERFLKTGFMATSNVSRYLDRGYDSFGTHAPKNPNHPDFVLTRESFGLRNNSNLSNVEEILIDIKKLQLNHSNWRKDCSEYRSISNLFYWAKFIFYDVLKLTRRDELLH